MGRSRGTVISHTMYFRWEAEATLPTPPISILPSIPLDSVASQSLTAPQWPLTKAELVDLDT